MPRTGPKERVSFNHEGCDLTTVVFELVEKYLSPIVEHVDAAVVEGGQHPGAVFVEGKTLDALALRLEFVMQVHLKLHVSLTYII